MKQNQLATIESKQFNQKEIALLRETYAKGLSDTETKVFLKQAEAMNLNPFTKDIYAMVVSGRLVLMISIEGRRKMAHKTGKYLGCKVNVNYDSSGALLSATALVKKLVEGRVAEFEATVLFDEFNTNQNKWKDMPHQMISKVAEATALRMAFPHMDNLYDEAEAHTVREIQAKEEIHDVVDYENESQESPGPGDFVVKLGSYKNTPKKVKDIAQEELREYVAWCALQEKLSNPQKDYMIAADAYLLEQSQ